MRKLLLIRPFYDRSPRLVARQLLGKRLVSEIDGIVTAGTIVETEAYLANGDLACHGARRRTKKNDVMFGRAGLAYVYPIHGRVCFNAVTQAIDTPSAVLIRAIQPTIGIEVMQERRNTEMPFELTRGPARLCESLGIWRSINGIDLTVGNKVWIDSQDTVTVKRSSIKVTTRIGVTSAETLKLRYAIAGCDYVSGPKRMR